MRRSAGFLSSPASFARSGASETALRSVISCQAAPTSQVSAALRLVSNALSEAL